ncbi:MAG TPA: membrane protein insertion efficiency factor YidD [Planctomycetota bacterium]|nr:membrane protein insertion efficiency factor YidD [Planctomycetota bacterium]
MALTVYLTAESFLPACSQPTAQASLALIHAYQATGSKMMESGGVHCRYTPTCSHYAEDAIGYYGTVSGIVRATGRIWRCSPWGGTGYDPAVEEHPAAYFAPEQQPQQMSDEEKRLRQEAERQAKEAAKAITAGCISGSAGCAIIIVTGLVYLAVKIFVMIWAFKDATARGDANAVIWPILIFFTSIIGFVVYMAIRPKGDMSPCPSCHKARLSTLTKCPHCSVDSNAPPKTA